MSHERVEDDLLSLFQQPKVIITHCRLSRQKNLHALLKIFKELTKVSDSKLKLVIVGDGELREELLAFCRSEGLRYWAVWDQAVLDNKAEVYFIGQQTNPFKFLRVSSLYIMTSGWEGFPLALCEAMACGLPVVTTDCFTGPREIIAPDVNLEQPVQEPYQTQYGVLMPLVNVNDSVAVGKWTNTIAQLVNKPDFRSSNEGGLYRIKEFEISRTIHETVQLIRDL
jgi:glycosyltransferase involved in cell wall biosynthesis